MRTLAIVISLILIFQIIGTTCAIIEQKDVKCQIEIRDDPGAMPEEYIGRWVVVNNGSNGPLPRSGHAMTYDPIRNDIYIFGGEFGSEHLNDFWRYSIFNDKWVEFETRDIINPRYGACIVYLNDYILLFGGKAGYGDNITFYNDTWIFNIAEEKWTKINTQSPSGRMKAAITTDGQSVYLFGGQNNITFLNDLWKFDIQYNTWNKINTSYVPSSSGCKMCYYSSENTLYLFGGLSGDFNDYYYSNSYYIYDITTNKWSEKKNTEISGRYDFGMTINNNEIFIYGGKGMAKWGDLWKFRISTDEWRQLKSNDNFGPNKISSFGMIIDTNQDIYVYGGYYQNFNSNLWRYNTEPTKIPPSLQTPIPNTYSIEEDNLTSGEHLIDLYDYFDDDIHVDELRFELSYAEDPLIVNATIDSHFLNFTQVKKDWFGQLGFQVRAYDKGWDDTPNTDDDLWVDSNVFNITVLRTPDPPVVESVFGTPYENGTVPEFEATVGWPFQGNVEVNDPDNEPLTFSTDADSDGFMLDAKTGDVVFTPGKSDIGTHTWHIAVDDGVFDPVTVEFIMNVVEGEPPPDPSVCDLTSPGDGITVGKEVVLGWTTEDAEKSVLFDVYLGNSDPPELYAEGITETQLTVEFDRAGIFYWTVVPRIDTIFGECSSGIWTFNVDLDFVPIYNFSLSASPDILLIEPGDDTVVNLKITNTGNVADSYSISTGGNVVDWVTIPEFDGTVLPGDSLTVPVILNVSDNAVNGNNKIDFTVSSENAGEKTVEVGVEVKAPEETDEKDWVVPAVVGIVVAILAVVGIGFFIQKRKGKEQLEEGKEYQK